jgi:hypothetical protein
MPKAPVFYVSEDGVLRPATAEETADILVVHRDAGTPPEAN